MSVSDIYINKHTGAAFEFDSNGMRVDLGDDNPVIAKLLLKCRAENDPEFYLHVNGVEYRVSTIEAVDSPTFVLRYNGTGFTSVSQLRLHEKVVERIQDVRAGLFLICGAYAQGKSTTARCLLRDSVAQGGVAICIEEPTEVRMQGPWERGYIFQMEVKAGGMADALRKVARFRAKAIFVGEIRDAEAAVATIQLALSGALVVVTSHGGSIQEALVRLHALASIRINTHDAAQILATCMGAVLHQKLEAGQLKTMLLRVDGYDRVRSILRSRSFEQLATEIDAQQISLFRDSEVKKFGPGGIERRGQRLTQE